MPTQAVVHVYGGLSNENVSGVRSSDLIFAGKQVCFWSSPNSTSCSLNSQLKGFWLTPYLRSKNIVTQKMLLVVCIIASHRCRSHPQQDKVASLIKTDLATEVQATFSLAELPDALHRYVNSMSGGKVCISPQKGLAVRHAAHAMLT